MNLELLRKIEKKLKLTALASQQFFGSQSVEMFCCEFETIYVKISKNMINPMKIQSSYFGWIGEIMSWSEKY